MAQPVIGKWEMSIQAGEIEKERTMLKSPTSGNIALFMALTSLVLASPCCNKKEKEAGKPTLRDTIAKHGFTGKEADDIEKTITVMTTKPENDSEDKYMERAESMIRLAAFGDKVVPLIVELAKDPDQAYPRRLVVVLLVMDTEKGKAAMDDLMGAKEMGDTTTSELIDDIRSMDVAQDLPLISTAGRVISKRGEGDIRKLLDAFRDECRSPSFSSFLAMKSAVGSVGRPAVPYLIRLLDDPSISFGRGDVVKLLGEIRDPAAIPVLRKIIEDPTQDTGVLVQAKWSLGQLGEKAEADKDAATARAVDGLFTLFDESESYFERMDRVNRSKKWLLELGPGAVKPVVDRVVKTEARFDDFSDNLGLMPALLLLEIDASFPDSTAARDAVAGLVDRLCSDETLKVANWPSSWYIELVLDSMTGEMAKKRPSGRIASMLASKAQKMREFAPRATRSEWDYEGSEMTKAILKLSEQWEGFR